MNFDLEIEFSKANIITEVEKLKKQIDAMRPLPADVEGRVMQKLRLDWNYNSNAIEGNKLNYGETVAFLMTGITAKGKPLKDHLDIRGHNEAINFLMSIVKDTRPLTEADIRALHEMILVEPYEVKAQTADGTPTTKRINLGEYKTLPNHVQTATGETHYYTSPEETPLKMRELMEWYVEAVNSPGIHPIVTAALFHHKFVSIHPFDDGNGRLSRILMNLILMKNGYPPAIIKMDDRQNYYALLSQADVNDSWPFVEYIAERLQSSLQLYLKAAKGGDIDEDEDIDKEIALFKMELQNKTDLSEKRSIQTINKVIKEQTNPLIQKIASTMKKFDELFFNEEKFIRFRYLYKNERASVRYDLKDNLIPKKEILEEQFISQEFHCKFKNFKSSDKMFDLEIVLIVEFDDYKYIIYDLDNKKFLSKYYHEVISKEESQLITKMFVSFTKLFIQNRLK